MAVIIKQVTEDLGMRLESSSREIAAIQASIRNAPKADSRPAFNSQDLERRVSELDREVRAQIERLDGDLKRLAAPPAKPNKREMSPTIQRLLSQREALVTPQTAEVRIEPSTPKTPPPPAFAPREARKNLWQEALVNAANESESKPELADVPDQELYAARVRNAAVAIQHARPLCQVAVVHLKKNPIADKFEIHVTDGFTCPVCPACQTWQFAVSMGPLDADEIDITLPLGTCGNWNFAHGYAALIDKLPAESSFSIGFIEGAATLHKASDQSKEFSVRRKMSWRQSAAEAGTA